MSQDASRVGTRASARETTRTDTDDIELEAALKELALDLGGDAVEADVAVGDDRVLHGRHDEGMPGVMFCEQGARFGGGPDGRRAEAR